MNYTIRWEYVNKQNWTDYGSYPYDDLNAVFRFLEIEVRYFGKRSPGIYDFAPIMKAGK